MAANTLVIRGSKGDLIKVDFLQVKQATFILRALNHQLRQHILKLLEKHGRLTVTEILIHLRIEQSMGSQHLAILRRAGIVKTEREGRLIYYSLNDVQISDIAHFVLNLNSK